MNGIPKKRSAEPSRRSILRAFAVTGGGAILGTMISGHRASAQTKTSQKVVGYQDMPKGAQRCDNCAQFETPSSCKIVEGSIAPGGWCKVYVKKPA